jgi:hypothetical protein
VSVPAWLLDAIHSTESECVPNVPNFQNQPWVQGDRSETPVNKGVEMNVPNVPSVPKGKHTLQDRQREARRQKVIAMLEAAPGTQRAIYVDDASDPLNIIVAVAVRNLATCEMLIPEVTKYDPWQLLELIERHGQATH